MMICLVCSACGSSKWVLADKEEGIYRCSICGREEYPESMMATVLEDAETLPETLKTA